MNKKIIVITGATASGKTKISINLAKLINAEIICADSRIVYKDLDIVSAKPTLEERDNVVHHLIDIIEPTVEFSAGDFVERAKVAINDIKLRGKNIIICGGTWFYIKSLLDEYSLPKCSINQELRDELNKIESNELWEMLRTLDEKRANLIHKNNKDKIIRSIEMCKALGEPISTYKRDKNDEFEALWFAPVWDREVLYERINKRVDIMIELGLYEEWQKNKEKYSNSKIMQNTIGYSEFYDLEKGIYKTKQEAIDKIKQFTRNFAKRQLTYFRSNNLIQSIKDENDIMKYI